MNRLRWCSVLWLTTALVATQGAWAQKDPRVGYVYPAGGQQGSQFEVTVGGQFLNGTSSVRVTGGGVQARVIEHIKALTRKELNETRQKLTQLQRQVQALQKSGGKPTKAAKPETAEKLAKELGLESADMKSIAELRKRLFDPKKQLNPQIAEKLLLKVEVAPDARPGERQLRLITSAGVSNPVFFHVGQWPEHRERELDDKTADGGSPEKLPVILNGQILPGDVDLFRFTAQKGEKLTVAASARKLIPYLADAVPGWFQATLTLTDAKGAEVAYSDDFRFLPDPVLFYEVPDDGEYFLEIRDAIYRGREDFVYRIALGEIPFVTGIFPLGGPAGEQTEVSLKGWNLPVDTMTVDADDKRTGVRPLSVRKKGRISNQAPFSVDTLPESLEVEPNDKPEIAEPVKLPRIVNGRIDSPGDQDVFRVECSSGDELSVEVLARRLNSPLDSVLKLTDSEGRLLVANDDHEDKGAGLTTHHADSRLQFRAPADGAYYVHLADAQDNGSPAYAYRLRISAPRPDFELRVVPSSVNARPGTIVPITVFALRQDGFVGDIALELTDSPEGFSLSGGWVPAHQDQVQVTLTVPSTPNKAPFRLRLEGRAEIGGQEVRRQAVPAEDRMQAFIYRHLVPSKDWMVAVTGRARGGKPMTILGEQPVKLAAGETSRVRISGPRGTYAKQLRLELADPPEGITIKGLDLDKEGPMVLLSVENGKAAIGLKGNLIVNLFTVREVKSKKSKKVNTRRFPAGALPAIPFEVVKP